MSFPTNPVIGTPHTIGNKTWYWDGSSWSLLAPTVTGSDHTHDTPKVLDDLLDVEVKQPAYSEQHDYYINEDPNVANGWGRYSCDTFNKKVTYNKYDLNGKDFKTIYDFSNLVDTTHRFAAFDDSWNSESKIIGLEEGTFTYTITYENAATVQLINNGGNSKLFGITGADYKALSDGAILVYRRNNELWGPEPNPVLESGNNITISKDPPENPNVGDVWVHDVNYYMYVWDGSNWFALTGPESGGGGGSIANNPVITLVSTRGLSFNNKESVVDFRLNQTKDQMIDLINMNITHVDYNPPTEPNIGDLFIKKPDFFMYVYDGFNWVGLTEDDSLNTGSGNRLEQPCQLIGGKPNSIYCVDGDSTIPSPVLISTTPPQNPKVGDLWFDSEHLELRVWYVTGTSGAAWVSSTHPGMRPDLMDEKYPDPLKITGPAVAQELEFSKPYKARIGWDILANPDNAGLAVGWDVPGLNGNFTLQPLNENASEVSIKFGQFGTYNVVARIDYRDAGGVLKSATDSVMTMVGIKSPDDPIRYHVTVVDTADGPKFAIDNEQQPHLNLRRNRKYIFDQSHESNIGYLFRFYEAMMYDANGNLVNEGLGSVGNEYSLGVEQLRTEVIFTVPYNAPNRLAYGSPVDNYMGFWIYPYDVDGSVNLP